MSDPEFGSTPSPAETPASTPEWGAPQPNHAAPPQYPTPPLGYAPVGAQGLSDNAAGAIAYITIIPAIIFLLLAPYSQKPFVRFHAVQELGLFVTMIVLQVIAIIPLLGWVVYIVGAIACAVMWVIAIYKASQGSAFKVPVIGDVALQISGYTL
jgi:uncharacterized membrane protein